MHFQPEPPAAQNLREQGQVDWAAVKAELMAHEGEWGLVAENIANSTPQQIRSGRYKEFRGAELDHFEFVTRKPEDKAKAAEYGPRRTDVWGRYTAKVARRVGG